MQRIARHPRRPAAAGFTLVEIVMVLAIIAMLAGIVVPRYGRASARYRADAAARRVLADLQNAQQRARAGSARCVVAFTNGSANYSITYPTTNGVAGAAVQSNLALPPFNSRITAATFGSTSSVTFDGFGTPSSDGTITVTCGNESKQLTVTTSTSEIKIIG